MDMSTKGPSMDWSPDSNLPNRYKLWKQKCNLIFDTILCEKSEEYKCKMLLCYSGDRGLELFNSWTLTAAEQKKLLHYWQNFETYVKPQANQIMARYKLYCLKQNSQSVDIWLTSASELATESGYTINIRDEMLRDHIVFATNSEMVRTKCLEVGDDLTLDQARKFALTYEHTQRQLKEMGSTQPPHDVHSVKHVQRFPNKKRHGKPGKHHAGNPPHNNPSATTPSKSTNKCLNCGGKRHPLDHCPAKAATCFKCGRNGHYANLCLGGKKPSINTINETDDASTYLLSLDATCNSVTFPKPVVNASVQPLTAPHSTNIPFKVDTGADVSILSKPDYIHTFQDPELCDLQKSSIVLTAFGGSDIVSLGSTTAKVTVKGHTCNISFIVTETLAPNILSYKDSMQLNLVQRINTVSATTKCAVLENYPQVFSNELGTLPGTYHITLNPDAKPVQQPPRPVPVHLKDAYKQELDTLEQQGVIKKITQYTDWVNSIVLVKRKNNTIRVCLDPRQLNKNIATSKHLMRRLDDILPEMSGAKFFTVADTKNGYWHISLDEESKLLTTFNTPWGKYCFERLAFGLTCAGDAFQQQLDQALSGLKGVTGIADDILIWGHTEKDHDAALNQLLQRCKDIGIHLNREKFQYKQRTVKFYGHILTDTGLQADPSKIDAIVKMPPPPDVKTLQSYLGLVNYMARFQPSLSSVSRPLRDLLKEKVDYVWSPEADKAFNDIKRAITCAPVLSYFDPKKDTVIQSDASTNGLGCALIQDDKPVCYASRALTEAESRYSNIERELLAAMWSLEHFNHYIEGSNVTLQTDHKPLVSIWSKSINTASPRIQRLLLRMSRYNVKLEYIAGRHNVIADALSRISLRTSKTTTPYSNAISIDEILCSTIQMSTTGTQRIRDETAKDVTLQHLTRTIVDGWPEVYKDCPADLHPFWNFRDELSVENQLLFKGDRVVIPSTLQPEILKHLHTGHMGTEKMQLRARSSVFWPGLTNDVKNITKSCEPCQKHAPKQRQEEILVHEPTATKPWSKLASDIFDIKGQSYIVIADYYSRFPYVKQLSNITSKSIINVFKPLFADHGFCDILVTDNGPSYVSKEFTTFLEDCSIRHITSSPMYPQSNGFAESMVKVMKNLITKSVESNEDPNWALQAYRATPLSASLPSPAEMLHGRPLRTNIPSSRPSAQNDDTLESQHRRQQSYVKPPKPSLPPLQQGQDVNMYNHTTHTWQPATVSNVLPTPRSYHLSTDNGGKYRRNRRDIRDASPNDPQCGTNRSIVHTDIADKIIPSAPRASNINGSPAKQPSTPNGSIDTGHYVTGSGRISKPPTKYE